MHTSFPVVCSPMDLVAPRLSPRERIVLAHVANGLTDQEIAVRCDCTVATVETHVQRIRAKLGARNRAHAVSQGYRHGHLGQQKAEAA